jgi:glycosyltransferase involved in cell wall biosynthesis
MRKVYARTAVILMPSLFEPFGRTPIEAGASGIPCIASDVGGLREAVGPQGIFLDPNATVEAWVRAVRQLENASVYKSQAEQLTAWVQRFDVMRLAPRFFEILEPLRPNRSRTDGQQV